MRPAPLARTFELLGCLGRGGYGEVYLANLRSASGLVQRVAIKVLHASLGTSHDAVLRLREEARLLASLDHPVIPRVYDVVRLADRPALVTEYIPGLDLRAAMLLPGFPLRAGVEVLAGVAEALAAAWTARSPTGAAMRLVHRDIKPGNIRISIHGLPHLLDFGIARAEDAAREVHTQTHAILGTLGYMAPERFGRTSEEGRGDVFSVGCVLFELATGAPLFDGMSLLEHASLSAHPQAFAAAVTDRLTRVADRELRSLIATCVAYTPASRPPPEALALRLEEYAGRAPGISLRRWCAARSWAEDRLPPGQLTGLVLVEGAPADLPDGEFAPPSVPTFEPVVPGEAVIATFEPGAPPVVAPVAATPARPPPFAVARRPLGRLVLLGAALVGVGAVGTSWALRSWAPPATAAPVVPPPVVAPVIEPVSTPVIENRDRVVTESEAPAEPRVRRRREPGTAVDEPPPVDVPPADVPVRVEPDRAVEPEVPASVAEVRPPEPPREEIQARSARWTAAGGVPVQLRDAHGSHPPGSVLAGRYAIWADFGAGFVDAGGVAVVGEGASVVVTCQRALRTCSAR